MTQIKDAIHSVQDTIFKESSVKKQQCMTDEILILMNERRIRKDKNRIEYKNNNREIRR